MINTKTTISQSNHLFNERYVIEEMAQGNMGYVLLCHDEKNNRPVAIKTFHDKYLFSQESRNKFIVESRFWLQCGSHPNIVRAFGFLYDHSKPHLILERIFPNNMRGTTLKDYIFTHPLDYQNILQIGISICDGLIHVLDQFPHFVHRDLKPENILIGDDLIPKVSDFGMVLEKGIFSDEYDQNDLTHTSLQTIHSNNRLIGTPAIASPEQCKNEMMDTRSDIYSFGCILYQLATKRLPFYGSNVDDYIKAHIQQIPIAPSDLDSSIQNYFSELILQCLEKKPDHRFSDFYHLREKLLYLYQDTFFSKPITSKLSIAFTANEHLDRAEAYSLLNSFSASQDEITQAELKRAEPFSLLKTKGIVSFRQQHYHDAKAYFDECIQYQSDSESYLWSARVHLALGNFKEALAILERSLENQFDYPELYLFYAKCLEETKNIKRAQQILQLGLSYSSRTLNLYKNLTTLYQITRDKKNELKTLQMALQKYPTEIDLHLRFAEFYMKNHEWEKSQDWIKQTILLPVNHPNDWYRLGALYLKLNQIPLAIEAWENSRQSGYNEPGFMYQLAQLYDRQGHYKKAYNILSKVDQLNEASAKLKHQLIHKLNQSSK